MMKSLGIHIRTLRKERNWTLRELASRCGLSVSFLSQVERGLTSLSIVSLNDICKALDLPIQRVLPTASQNTETESRSPIVNKLEQQMTLQVGDSPLAYTYLSGDFPARVIEVFIGKFPPHYEGRPTQHDGEEFGYVLDGILTLRAEDTEYQLDPGESYHFDADVVHSYATTSSKVSILWAMTAKVIRSYNRNRIA